MIIGIRTLWIEFGHGKSLKWMSVHDIRKKIGTEKSDGLLFFHEFTTCDVVPAFQGKGKKTAWQTWDVCPDVTDVFSKLSKYPQIISEHDQNVLQMFVIMMYDRSSPTASIDDARLDLLARKQRSYESISPTHGALIELTQRATYQAGCIWGQATEWRKTGHRKTGHQKTGHRKIGHQKTGHQKTRHQKTGHQKTGHRKTGHCKTWHQKLCL